MTAPASAPVIAAETPADAHAIETLHALSFGPGRFARAAFRLREQGPHDMALSRVAHSYNAALIGSVRMTWVTTGAGQPAGLLLGPLAVMPDWKNQGVGKALMRTAMEGARASDAAYVLLVGDAPYYAPFGFAPVKPGAITMPGPVDPRRLLMAALKEGEELCGIVRHVDQG